MAKLMHWKEMHARRLRLLIAIVPKTCRPVFLMKPALLLATKRPRPRHLELRALYLHLS